MFSFLGFWLLRKWLGGHATYVLDTDWFVRIPGMLLIRFCKGPLPAFGAYMDEQVMRLTAMVIAGLRNPNLETKIYPAAIGFSIFMALILFCALLVSRI
jgi:hypothetical protein